MGKSKLKIEAKKKDMIKSAIALLDEQAKKLEVQKQAYTEKGRDAKLKGLNDQYNLALSGLRMAVTRQKRIYAVKLNLELAVKTGDMLKISAEFLQGLKSIAEEMFKLTGDGEFEELDGVFGEAKKNADAAFRKNEIYVDELQAELLSRKDD